MNKKTSLFPLIAVSLLMAMAFMIVQPAQAEGTDEVALTGTVMSTDELTLSLEIETEEGEEYTIFVPEDFDLSTLSIGDLVEVKGTTNEDGSIAATEILIVFDSVEVEITGSIVSLDPLGNTFDVEAEDGELFTFTATEGFDWTSISVGDLVEVSGISTEDGSVILLTLVVQDSEDGEEETRDSYYCTQSEVPHPFGAVLAERYQVDYAILQGWFCDGYGWGQVMLALQTGQMTDTDPSALLAARKAGEGWGRIWQELKLIGNHNDEVSSNETDGESQPADAGPSDNEHGNGRPDHAGPHNDEDGDGHPDHPTPHKNPKHTP
jgi:hypothetical protein